MAGEKEKIADKKGLIHAVAIIFVTEVAKGLNASVDMLDEDGRMPDAVECSSLDGGVVNHILEDDLVAYRKRTRETPRTHEIAREARVAAKAVERRLVT